MRDIVINNVTMCLFDIPLGGWYKLECCWMKEAPRRSEMGTTMFTIPYNTTLFVVAAIVFGVLGFVIYGCIKGWDNVLKEDYEKGPHH